MRDGLIETAREMTALFEPKWNSRKAGINTVISLASSALVFSVTFSSSVIHPWTPRLELWGLSASWVMLTVTILLCLGALWFSINLGDYPAIVASQNEEIIAAINAIAAAPTLDDTRVQEIMDKGFKYISKTDVRCRRLFHAALITYGIALLTFMIFGLGQWVL